MLVRWDLASLVTKSTANASSAILPSAHEKVDHSYHDHPSPYSHYPPWMAAYVELHKSRVLTKNLTVSSANESDILSATLPYYDNDEPYLQWVCRQQGMCGGLGDRLYGIVMSLYVALQTNRTFLLEGWRNPVNMTSFLEPAHIQWNLSVSHSPPRPLPSLSLSQRQRQQAPPHYRSIRTIDQSHHPFLLEPCQSKLALSNESVVLYNNVMPNDELLSNSTCLTYYWDSFGGRRNDSDSDHRSLFAIGFWTLFRFTPLVHERANRLRQVANLSQQEHGSDDNDNTNDGHYHHEDGPAGRPNVYFRPYVAIHIRTGKGSTWNDPVRHGGQDDPRRFYECATKLQEGMHKRLNNNNMTMTSSSSPLPDIYIAADNANVKAQVQAFNKDGTAKMVSNLEVFHIDRSRVAELANKDEAYLDVWGEFKVLIDATCLVMSRSKFSEAAAQLMRSPSLNQQLPPCAIRFDECSNDNVTLVLDRAFASF